MTIAERVEQTFRKEFQATPLMVRSPGRVNLIGEHTDYNMGFVLPAAIDRAIYLALSPRTDGICDVVSLDMKDRFQAQIHSILPSSKRWPNYVLGVVDQLLRSGMTVGGFNCVFGGDIPIGAGLSSSAALEAGLAFGLDVMFALGLDSLAIAKLAQRAENQFVGVQCGIMDQYANMFGKKGNVIRIDCRSLEYTYVPFQHDVSIVLFDTRVKHSLASSEYNKRREECEQGMEIIRRTHPEAASLRDVTVEQVHALKSTMDPVIFQRCRYVVEENARVMDGCAALEKGDLRKFGELMYGSHNGLSTSYQVSCPELDHLVEHVQGEPGVYGARMMGGGFGGCTINLIAPSAVDEVSGKLLTTYKKSFGVEPFMYRTVISAGTGIISNYDKKYH